MIGWDWRWVGYLVGGMIALSMGAGTPAASASESAKKAAESPDKAALPTPLPGFSDEGVFHVYKDGNRFATNRFKWGKDGSFTGQTHVSVAGKTADSVLKITPGKDGRWSSISMDTPLGPVEMERDGGVARVTFRGQTKTVALKPGTMLFDNLNPALMSQAIRTYDRTKRGKQSFPLHILPRMVMEGSLEFKNTVKRAVKGRQLTFWRYLYVAPGIDLTVWADQAGKVYFAEAPAHHAAYVREGYETLRATGKAGATSSNGG